MKNEDIRWIQRFNNYSKAFTQLENAVNLANERELSDLEKQGLTQAFEYTHELAWKTLKDFLSNKGNRDFYGSKDATREAFKYGLITAGEVWMDMIKSRSIAINSYLQKVTDNIVDSILNNYYFEFKKVGTKLIELKLN